MSDNVPITAGSGTDVATDDVAGVQYQRVKITLGADGFADTDVDSGQQVMSLSLPVVIASDQTVIPVSGTFTTTPPANATTNISQINGVTPLMGAGNTGTGSPRVTIASDQATIAVNDGGGSITVDGTVQVTNSLESYAEDTAHVTGDIGVMTLAVRKSTAADLSAGATDGDYEPLEVDATGRLWVRVGADDTGSTVDGSNNAIVVGNVAHDGVDASNPVKVGHKAIAHGANPTAVAAADRTDSYANRHGIPFVIGGHMNVITKEWKFAAADGAQTNAALITVSAGTKIVVTGATVTADNANTVNVDVRIGFATATLTAISTSGVTGIVLSHPGIAAGSGVSRGDGSGILGIGADDEDLRITSASPTTGSIRVVVTYYTIES